MEMRERRLYSAVAGVSGRYKSRADLTNHPLSRSFIGVISGSSTRPSSDEGKSF